MKKILPEYSFSEEQLHTIAALSEKTGYTEHILRILYARGVDTEEKIRRFMNPSAANFLSPFLMRGMKEAVELITTARDLGQTVAVFGDYDADGVCASSILYYALREFGIEPHVYVPERTDGYGLSVAVVDRIFEDCQPELFITVDCGISCAKEAQYIYELGADVIITDHHELPENLPDCVVVNPKLEDDYPYDNLCGAGVAFKLAVALLGERAYEYLDFAALATVADSVPLLGENRDIVTEGLKRINARPRSCFSALLGKNGEQVTAQTLAFTLAPRINAAGRMGDAKAALELFTATDERTIYDLAVKLCSYNAERQKYCDELYASAKEKLKKKGAYGNVILLYDDNWNTGFVGIVAARLAEEFARPTVLFVKQGNMLKGSARSIDGVNIFSALRSCSALLTEFGGHSQAAGVKLRVEDFDMLETALDREIGSRYQRGDFEQRVYVSEEITAPFPEKFAHELNAMEPYGVGHRRPMFSICARACSAKLLKAASPHVNIQSDFLELLYFSGAKDLNLIESDVKKQIVFEINISQFRGKEYIKGFVRDVLYDGRTGANASDRILLNEFERIALPPVRVQGRALTTEETEELIARESEKCAYGLCMIASDRRTLTHYKHLDELPCDLFYPSSKSLCNTLLVAPAADADLLGYRTYVFLDTPSDFNIAALQGKEVYYNKEVCGYQPLLRLDTRRDRLAEIFAAIRREAGRLEGENAQSLAESCGSLGFDKRDFLFAVRVFSELSLLAFESGKPIVFRGVKVDLNESNLYRRVCRLGEE